MSTLAKLSTLGLLEEFNNQVAAFKKPEATDESVKTLVDLVDAKGLRSPEVMKLIGSMQKAGTLTPGLYTQFTAINDKLSAGEAPAGDAPAAEGEGEESTGSFTMKQEDRIKALLRKEEEKNRQRLLKKEEAIRLRMSERAEKRAQRLGVKVGESKEITEQREVISAAREVIKAQRLVVKTAREAIAKLRPSKPKATKEEKAAKKAAAEASV